MDEVESAMAPLVSMRGLPLGDTVFMKGRAGVRCHLSRSWPRRSRALQPFHQRGELEEVMRRSTIFILRGAPGKGMKGFHSY